MSEPSEPEDAGCPDDAARDVELEGGLAEPDYLVIEVPET